MQEANRRIDAMLAQEELDEDQDQQDEPAELESNSGKSSSLAGAAAEGFKFIGSFFAQAAMGGAEVSLASKSCNHVELPFTGTHVIRSIVDVGTDVEGNMRRM